jgi:hypothetical protein
LWGFSLLMLHASLSMYQLPGHPIMVVNSYMGFVF